MTGMAKRKSGTWPNERAGLGQMKERDLDKEHLDKCSKLERPEGRKHVRVGACQTVERGERGEDRPQVHAPTGKCSKNKSENRGLISADRNNKATLLLTIPRSTIVVCYGFILSNILYCYSEATKITLPCLGNPPCYDTRAETLFVII